MSRSAFLLGGSSVIVAVALAGAASVSRAATLETSLPAWEAAAITYSETTSFGVPDGTSISGFTTTDGVSVSVNEDVTSIGDGWETWCCGYTGQVLADYSSTSVSYTLNTPVTAFGFFAEPDPFEILAITLDLSDGGTVTQDVNGLGGASFFGWVGGGVTGFTVSSSADFAVGDFYSSIAVPEPSTWAMMLLGFAGLGFAGYRQRRKLAGAVSV